MPITSHKKVHYFSEYKVDNKVYSMTLDQDEKYDDADKTWHAFQEAQIQEGNRKLKLRINMSDLNPEYEITGSGPGMSDDEEESRVFLENWMKAIGYKFEDDENKIYSLNDMMHHFFNNFNGPTAPEKPDWEKVEVQLGGSGLDETPLDELVLENKDEEEGHEVEMIVAHKKEDGKTFYEVKWVGWPSSSNTWEPEEHVLGTDELTDYIQNNNVDEEDN